ncbi:hypothetical protein C923_03474 [Plasmodium falciparum UGT5.1]|uniref:Uncharacterized protein n=1 Tax=Plasmodium falciparum UGT5.1 TaxID=1237627 RepID=W7J9Z3_PLAFA|nr:hypothetical protein C923_03474 [Plasmodium falciparum UGT5.1]
MKERNVFNGCISVALEDIIQELNRKKEMNDFDEMKKNVLLNIQQKANKKHFTSVRKVEKILSKFLEENKNSPIYYY